RVLFRSPGTGCIQQAFANLHRDRSWAFGDVNRKPAAAGSSDAKINGVIARPVLAPRRRPDSERIRPVLFQFRWGNDLRVAIGEVPVGQAFAWRQPMGGGGPDPGQCSTAWEVNRPGNPGGSLVGVKAAWRAKGTGE